MKKALKYACILFAVLLFMPLIQRSIKPLPRIKLHGTFKEAKEPKLTLKGWFDGSYQRDYEEYFNQRQGMRTYLVTTYNQITFWLFGRTPDTGGTVIVPGVDDYLFEQSYVELYNSENTHPETELREKAKWIRRLQDELKARDIGFVLIIAPSKVELHPDKVEPGRLKPGRENRRTTYDVMIPILAEAGVAMIDAKPLFFQWKEEGEHPLYARTGTHWNYISAGRIASLAIARLGSQLGYDLPNVTLESVVVDDKVYGKDNDLGELMNIWQEKKLAGPQHHPVFSRSDGAGKKPNYLFVGDSFSHTLIDVINANGLCSNTDLFYYYERFFDSPADEFGSRLRRSQIDWERDVFKRDAIVIQINEYWLPKIGFGFVEDALERMGIDVPGETEYGTGL